MITIARPIGETTLNGVEWLLDKKGDVMLFKSRKEAIKFLKKNGFNHLSDEDFEDEFLFEEETEKNNSTSNL